jgi:penicillin-binding protein 1C
MTLQWSRRRAAIVAACGAAALAAGGAWVRLGPLPPGFLALAEPTSTVVVDRRGEVLYESRSAFGTRGVPLRADALPVRLVEATLAAEDVRFFGHSGVDPLAIGRAAWRNVRTWSRREGGSTITQQVAKLLLQRRDADYARRRGWAAKIHEAVLAERLEHHLSKRDILALYLNLAPYGNQIDGAQRASLEYFGRDASTLTAAEAAFLAALPQQPSRYNPRKDATRARARQLAILQISAAEGWLSPEALTEARGEQLALAPPSTSFVAPHFVARVLAAHPEARRIETTLDATLQRAVTGIIRAQRDNLRQHHAANVAVAVMDNATGGWLAWEGSGNYADAEHGGAIDGVTAPRQPGSALKPFTYAAALERGRLPSMVLADVPSQFPTAKDGILYRPRNYDGVFRGPMLMRAALAGSENVPAVQVAAEIGVPAIAQLLRQAGLTTLSNDAAHYGLGLTLGNAEVRLDELTAAYAAFARAGLFRAPVSVTSVEAHSAGAAGARAPSPRDSVPRAIVSPRTAFWITSMLSDPEARAYIFGRGGSLEFPYPVAAKTGTSTAYHDNWALGYTKDVTVGVWVGNFDRTPLRNSSGVTGAGPIFHDVMNAAMELVGPAGRGVIDGALPLDGIAPIVAPDPALAPVELCARSGRRAGEACPSRVIEWLPTGAAPDRCDWHVAGADGLVTIWPERFRQWAADAGYVVPAAAAPATTARRDASSPAAPRGPTRLTITSPLAGATFLIDPTLRPEFQSLRFAAAGGAPGPLIWSVDGAAIDGARWPLARGTHRVQVRDARGDTAEARITVK